MAAEVHLLNKSYIDEKKLVSSIKRIAKEKQLSFSKSDGYYIVSVPNFGDQLEFFINTKNEYEETFDPRYYPDTPEYGANVILGYYNDDSTLVSFLKEFLKEFSEIKVYVGENLPSGVDSRLYSKIDFDLATTTDTFTFLSTPPMENGNTVV